MNIYLAIITTVLVLTQLIRITQNHIQLKKQGEMIDRELKELQKYSDIESYVELQHAVFDMLYEKLKADEG